MFNIYYITIIYIYITYMIIYVVNYHITSIISSSENQVTRRPVFPMRSGGFHQVLALKASGHWVTWWHGDHGTVVMGPMEQAWPAHKWQTPLCRYCRILVNLFGSCTSQETICRRCVHSTILVLTLESGFVQEWAIPVYPDITWNCRDHRRS